MSEAFLGGISFEVVDLAGHAFQLRLEIQLVELAVFCVHPLLPSRKDSPRVISPTSQLKLVPRNFRKPYFIYKLF